ncbi:MAG: carbohydrate ABC transporter permease [Armatimonadota bacterium]|nr:carbohydrate ABC transporter permease [Armatimonadota bacterium]MDR7422222.1 carbohydrate ABC transporter permease [Armatimonadota bacterium]MDR7454406.1 carbohydrate ABC transporter permease [Armatimonadota bacterium]MDR7495755.1 carbohydrate ABC transporter permease [Armatimonadota bacterium]MDR7511050.1 carbohydrate ABC transporter permease [Armatimonadota bacterium]
MATRARFDPKVALIYAVLAAGTVVVAFPFFWMLSSALKPPMEIFDLRFLPQQPTLDNIRVVLTRTQFPRWFWNSFVVAAITTLSVAFFDSLVGYALAKLRFWGREVIFVLILATLMIPTEMLVIPWYILSSSQGWINTYWGIMFPGLITAFGIFLVRQFMSGVPDELLDAGRIDGVSEFGLYWRIALPQIKPAMAALCIFTFLGNWNAFLWPMIVIQSASMRTLPVGIALFSGEAGSLWHLIMASSALAVIPVLLVFAVLQRQIIEGIVLTGLKN